MKFTQCYTDEKLFKFSKRFIISPNKQQKIYKPSALIKFFIP
jgi:hypothetical protein